MTIKYKQLINSNLTRESIFEIKIKKYKCIFDRLDNKKEILRQLKVRKHL